MGKIVTSLVVVVLVLGFRVRAKIGTKLKLRMVGIERNFLDRRWDSGRRLAVVV